MLCIALQEFFTSLPPERKALLVGFLLGHFQTENVVLLVRFLVGEALLDHFQTENVVLLVRFLVGEALLDHFQTENVALLVRFLVEKHCLIISRQLNVFFKGSVIISTPSPGLAVTLQVPLYCTLQIITNHPTHYYTLTI